MSDEEVDQELVELRELKSKLLRRAYELKKELEEWENAKGKTLGKKAKDFIPADNELENLIDRHEENENCVTKKCVSLSSFMLGIKFSDVNKKWISGDKYLYTANVKSKVLEFFLQLTVNCEDLAKGFDVSGIVCRFVNVRKCYVLEITSWVKRFTNDKDTSNLFSAVSNYSEQNVIRTKILAKFQNYNIVYAQEYTEDDGGIIVFLHAKNEPSSIYFEIRWVLRFIESIWHIDNFFIIQPISAEDDFLNENSQLLQEFCERKIAKTKLEQLWDQLCAAVEQDSGRERSESSVRTEGT